MGRSRTKNYMLPRQIAQLAQCEAQYVSDQVKRGELIAEKVDGKIRIDSNNEKNLEWIAKKSQNAIIKKSAVKKSSFGGRGKKIQSPKTKLDYDIEKIKAQTAVTNLKIAQELGKLILRSEVDKAFGNLSGVIVNHVHPMGDRLAHQVAGVCECTDATKIARIKKIIDDENMRMLSEVKRQVSKDFKV